MINPANINIIEDKNAPAVRYVTIDEVPEFDMQAYDLLDDKDFKKYMQDVERRIRTSFEYRNYINFLRDNLNMNTCAFYEKINNVESRKIAIHIHHHPFTLYDIVKTVYNKRCANRESVKVEDVAKEVMYLHYSKLVGLIPLSETVHELVHSQYLFIPMNFAFGDFLAFKSMYEPYMDPELLETFEVVQNVSYDCMSQLENNNNILRTTQTYLNKDRNEMYNAMLEFLNERIEEIKNGAQPYIEEQHKLKNPINIIEGDD